VVVLVGFAAGDAPVMSLTCSIGVLEHLMLQLADAPTLRLAAWLLDRKSIKAAEASAR
jgi:hypothetical protein